MADLAQARRQFQVQLVRRQPAEMTLVVGMDTAGIAAGAREVMRALVDAIATRGLSVHVMLNAGLAQAGQEPLVQVMQKGGATTTYGQMSVERVARLVEEHLVQGQPITDWVIRETEQGD